MQKKKEVRVKAKSNNNCRNICKGKQNKNKKKKIKEIKTITSRMNQCRKSLVCIRKN